MDSKPTASSAVGVNGSGWGRGGGGHVHQASVTWHDAVSNAGWH